MDYLLPYPRTTDSSRRSGRRQPVVAPFGRGINAIAVAIPGAPCGGASYALS